MYLGLDVQFRKRLTCILKGEGSGTLERKRDEEKRNGELAGSQRLQTCHGDEVPILSCDDRKPNGI
jgi:hypothetical protein